MCCFRVIVERNEFTDRQYLQPIGMDEPDEVGQFEDQFDFVGRTEDGLVLLDGNVAQQLKCMDLVGVVEEGSRFVEQDDVSLLCYGLSYHDLLSFAIAESMDHAVGQMRDAYTLKARVDNGSVGSRKTPKQRRVGSAPQAHHIANRETMDVAVVGEDDAEDAGEVLLLCSR